MRTIYSSEGLIGNRRAAWQAVIKDVYANLDIDIGANENFSARICRRTIGAAELTEVAAGTEHARRTPRHISRAASNAYLYLLVRSGRLTVAQQGRECSIGPGEFTLLHLDQPYVFSHADRVEKIGLKVPTHHLRLRDADLAQHCAAPRSASVGIARLAASFVDGLTRDDLSASEASAHGLSKTAADLLCLLFDSLEMELLSNDTAVRAAIRRRSESYMAANASNCDLDPCNIAAAMGISIRYLHDCFTPIGTTVMQKLRDLRLSRAHAELVDPGLRKLPIAEIAVRNGFRNVCHFNATFKARYGATPRDIREQAPRS